MARAASKRFTPKPRSRKSKLRTTRLIENNNQILKRYAEEINSNKLLDC